MGQPSDPATDAAADHGVRRGLHYLRYVIHYGE